MECTSNKHLNACIKCCIYSKLCNKHHPAAQNDQTSINDSTITSKGAFTTYWLVCTQFLGHKLSASWQSETLLISFHHLLAFSAAQRRNMVLQARDQRHKMRARKAEMSPSSLAEKANVHAMFLSDYLYAHVLLPDKMFLLDFSQWASHSTVAQGNGTTVGNALIG